MSAHNHVSVLLLCLLAAGCSSSPFTAAHNESSQVGLAIEEMRVELADIQHALSAAKTEVHLLEEKVKAQDGLIASLKGQPSSKYSSSSKQAESPQQLGALERKIGQIEKAQEKIFSDLKQLSLYAAQTSTTFGQYKDRVGELEKEIQTQGHRLDEVSKLKSTLASLSQVMNQKGTFPSVACKKYKVKSGDSLEKIARSQGISVSQLKEHNRLNSDRLSVGQELDIPNE